MINPQARPHLETIAGSDQLLIVDDFYRDPYQVREYALQQPFAVQPPHVRQSRGGFYPGRTSMLPSALPEVADVLEHVRALLSATFGLEIPPSGIVTDFAVITLPPPQLPPVMKHPHADHNPLLGLVYLNPFIDSGTSFYRHRETGLHAIRTQEQHRFIIDFGADPKNSQREQGYILGSNRYWERVHRVAGTFNRFVAYSGRVLHSADAFIPRARNLGNHRVTQRFLVP